MDFKKIMFTLLRPITSNAGKIKVPDALINRKVTKEDVENIKLLRKNGDVLLSKSDWHLTNLAIKGNFKHAAMIFDNGVIEAVDPVVQYQTLESFCETKDEVCLLRANYMTEAEGEKASIFAFSLIGCSYDYLFEWLNRMFYCSELIIYSQDAIIGEMRNPFKRIYNDRLVLPNDFYDAKEKFTLIYQSGDSK